MEKLSVLESCLYVEDLEAAEAFYREVLGLELVSCVAGRHVFFRLQSSMLLLFRAEASLAATELPPHGARGPGHLCFRIAEAEYESWKARLAQHAVPILAEQAWPRGGRSLYFHDPAGNLLELAPARIWPLESEEAKGQPA